MENFYCSKSAQAENPPPPKKKKCVHFPVTNTVCKQHIHFITYSSFPGDLKGRGQVIFKGIVIEPFNYAEQCGYHKILIGLSRGERGFRCPPIF